MTTTILAAIDDSSAAAPVLAAGDSLASLLDLRLDVLHVVEHDAATATAASAADRAGVPMRVVHGEDVVDEIIRAAGDPSVVLVVIGTSGKPTGIRPVGHVALAVVEQADKPVLAVHPEAITPGGSRPIRRVLVPLEGTPETSGAVADVLRRLAAAGVELHAVHVFDASTVPAFWGRPGHGEQSWASEFLSRWCGEPGVELHVHRGAAPETIVDAAGRHDVDLIALGWSQDLSPGHAAVVRAVLTSACAPVLLLPLPPAA